MDEKMNEKFKEFYDSLTDEQKEKVKNCKTEEEFTAFGEEEDIELPEELLENVAGGFGAGWRILEYISEHMQSMAPKESVPPKSSKPPLFGK